MEPLFDQTTDPVTFSSVEARGVKRVDLCVLTFVTKTLLIAIRGTS